MKNKCFLAIPGWCLLLGVSLIVSGCGLTEEQAKAEGRRVASQVTESLLNEHANALAEAIINQAKSTGNITSGEPAVGVVAENIKRIRFNYGAIPTRHLDHHMSAPVPLSLGSDVSLGQEIFISTQCVVPIGRGRKVEKDGALLTTMYRLGRSGRPVPLGILVYTDN